MPGSQNTGRTLTVTVCVSMEPSIEEVQWIV